MPWNSLINLSIYKITPTLLVSQDELSFSFTHVNFEGEIDFISNKFLKHRIQQEADDLLIYIVKVTRKGSLIGYGELKIPLSKPNKATETTISRSFEIKMIESTKKEILGPNSIHTKMKVEIDAKIKWVKVNQQSSFDKSNSYRQIIKTLTPKVENKPNLVHSNNLSSTLETELSMLKTPPNKFTRKNNIYLENKFYYTNPNMFHQLNKKNNNTKQWPFTNNDSTVNNNSSIQVNISCAHSCDLILSSTIPSEMDPYVSEKTFEFLSKYSKDNIGKTADCKNMLSITKTMIKDMFNYMNLIKDTYQETIQLNRILKLELKSSNEHYRHMIKVKSKLVEKKNQRQIASLIRVSPSKKYSNVKQIALNANQTEVKLLKELFNSIALYKDKEIDKFKESKLILSQMSIDDQSIVLLLTIKNIIANYGKISLLVHPQYLAKLQRILRLYDIKEKVFKVQKLNMFHSMNNNIRQITEQDNEEDDEEEKEKEMTEEIIRRTLIDDRFLSRVPFVRSNGNSYTYGTLKVNAMIENGIVKLIIGNKIFPLKQFIAYFEQIEERKDKINKGQKPATSKRNSQNHHGSVKTL